MKSKEQIRVTRLLKTNQIFTTKSLTCINICTKMFKNMHKKMYAFKIEQNRLNI